MCVVLVFTVRIRTILQLHPFGMFVRIRTILQIHPFGMFQGLFVRYREPVLDIHHDDAIISDVGIRSCIHITMVQPRLRRICTHVQARENHCNSPSQNMDADEHSNINQFKPSVLFVGHMQIVDTQTRRRTIPRLIRVSTVCLQNVLSTLNKDENYHSTTIQTEIDWPN